MASKDQLIIPKAPNFQRQRTLRITKKAEPSSLTQKFAERWAPNFYIERREGQVLSRGMLIKYDIFPSSKIVRTDVSVSGGPNYRKIDEALPLCAVGQPSIHGIRTILNLLIGSPHFIKMQKQLNNKNIDNDTESFEFSESDLLSELNNMEDAMILMPEKTSQIEQETIQRCCIWLNLREEPVVYLNNRPFVLRDADHPFRNIQTFKGITWQHLREVEQRLKRDILIEASLHHNILIHKENAKQEVIPCWEGVTHQTVQTSEEAFKGLISEGYDVQYYRIPLTPESDLLNYTIDAIFKITIKHSIKTQEMPYFIINCQMGRGRSTLVTILVWLIFKKLGLADSEQMRLTRANSIGLGGGGGGGVSIDMIAALSPSPMTTGNIASFPFTPKSPPPPRKLYRRPSAPATSSGLKKSQSSPSFAKLRIKKAVSAIYKGGGIILNEEKETTESMTEEHGDYEVINRVLRVLSNGKDAKQAVDDAIESCGGLYNIKHEMAKCRLKLENSENDDEKEFAAYSTTALLSKYCTLISFAAFLYSVKLQDLSGINENKYDFNKNSFSEWMSSVPSLQKIRADIPNLKYEDLMQKYKTKMPKSMNALLIMNRIGSVLSANTILKADISREHKQRSFRKLKLNEKLKSVKFRFLEDVGIATCSQPPSIVIESILKNKLKMELKGIIETEIMEEEEEEEKKTNDNHNDVGVTWIDLREEPILYIRSRPYVVRNYNRPYQRLPEFDNLLTGQQINGINIRLKEDIQVEAADNDNKILVHFENQSHELKESTLPIDMTNPNEIQTTQQIFDALLKRGYKISYKKLPFNPKNSSEFGQLERLGKVITSGLETDSTIIFSCREGIQRSTVASIVAILIAYHRGKLAYVTEDDEYHEAFKSRSQIKTVPSKTEEVTPNQSPLKMPLATPEATPDALSLSPPDTNNNNNNNNNKQSMRSSSHSIQETIDANYDESDDEEIDTECRAVLALMRILRKGLVMKRQVDNAIEHCSEYYHIKESIYASREKWENARTAEESSAYLQTAMRHLRIYTNLICYNAYLYEYYHAKRWNETESNISKKYKLLSFTEWMKSRGELSLWLSKMIEKPQLALSMNQMDFDDEQEEKGFTKVFEQRGKESNVLSGNAMLKVDYFPGCAQLTTHPEAEHAINFRYIDAIGVAGCAIPTSQAMEEVVLFCGQKWKSKSSTISAKASIHWMCLREEPVLYVNEEPVVLRELHQPYENLIFTGITTKRVEAMEKTLKQDATSECSKFENKLLIHAESDTGNLEAEYEEVTDDEIMTCREAYTRAFDTATISNPNIDAIYHRLPITDEQAPPADIVDTFISLFEQYPNDSIFIFNCQMGRGRTTTGMVIYALWKRKCALCQIPVQNKTPSKSRKSNTAKNEDKEAFLNGEYNAVLSLLRILPQGKQAKRWCDDVLNVLSHMQNLRKAIYQMQLRGAKAVSDKSRTHLAHRAKNYLQRYCLLIAFASYLLHDYKVPVINDDEQKKKEEPDKLVTFKEYLEERAAVKNCIYSASIHD